MNIRLLIILITTICSYFFVTGGLQTPAKTGDTFPYTPKGWPKPPKQNFRANPITESGFQLGRKLFYDGNLSSTGEISCGSCHQQQAAFANYDHNLSHGVNDSQTTRNAPALINVAWMKNLHWDGAINHIEMQPLAPLTNPKEMGQQLETVMTYLKNDSSYRRMFKEAFGDTTISSQRMLKALTQFVGSLVSSESRYDKMKRGEIKFTPYEENGYKLFKQNCASCHQEPLFTDNSFRNNGRPLNKWKDVGLYGITQKSEDSLKFKVPTLRNIQLSFPYMHDGHIYSLFQAIDHYTGKIDTTRQDIDPVLKKKINLTNRERSELVFFLYTLTDSSFIKNPRLGPDKKPVIKNPHHAYDRN
jgi:cytochrome c peroxidase